MSIISFSFYTIFQFACAGAPNGKALLVFRFLGGCFAACPLTNSGAILSDMYAPLVLYSLRSLHLTTSFRWDNESRGTAMVIYILSPFAGLAVGLITSGYIVVRGISWRWVFWIHAILAVVCFFLTVFGIPETFAPVLLVKKARTIRKETGDERFTAALERQHTHWRARLQAALGRPFKIMFLEPLLLVLTLYMSVRSLGLFARLAADNTFSVYIWDCFPPFYCLPCHFH
jgi:MFS family permease